MNPTRPRRVKGLYFVLFAISALMLFMLTGCNVEAISSEAGLEIDDVVIVDKHIYYDGNYHGLDIVGLHDSDVVSYADSVDGVFSLTPIVYKDIGAYVIYVKVEREGCGSLTVSATLYISRPILDGISASDAVFEYDGLPHDLTIDGVLDGDSVVYSIDGETFSPDLDITNVGTYTVYYCVTRGFAEYRDSAVVTIVPSASGTYFNSSSGVIRIYGFSTSDGEPVTYDILGNGFIGDKPFSLHSDHIVVDGVIYDRLTDGASVYTLSVNGAVVLYFADDTVDIDVSFGSVNSSENAGATISFGSSVLSFPNFNFCESINSIVNTGSSCGMTYTSSSTNIEIILSLREAATFDPPYAFFVYDGLPHTIPAVEDMLYEADGQFVSAPPSFTEIGSYAVRVIFAKPDFLPAYGVATLVIAPSPDGVYYSVDDKTIISIENCVATKNYLSATLEYSDDGWLVDGILLSEYSALSSDTLFVITIDSVIADLLVNASDIEFVAIDGTTAFILDSYFDTLYSFELPNTFVALYYNGSCQVPLSLPGYDHLFGVGVSDAEPMTQIVVFDFVCA